MRVTYWRTETTRATYLNFADAGSSPTCRQSRRLARLNYDKSVTGEKHLEALSAAAADSEPTLLLHLTCSNNWLFIWDFAFRYVFHLLRLGSRRSDSLSLASASEKWDCLTPTRLFGVESDDAVQVDDFNFGYPINCRVDARRVVRRCRRGAIT